MSELVALSSPSIPQVSDVGGKAASLIRLRQAGFNVPDGFVLNTDFFSEWNETLSSSNAWQAVDDASPDDLNTFTQKCDQLKIFASKLQFTQQQVELIQQSLDDNMTYAVRSSSPEEDLADSSFAGLYETILNVSHDKIVDAVHTCYLSCLDARVLIYKHKLHMAIDAPRIAVVVQVQVDSDVSGVAFSLNPVNNDFDEALINATFGLGEALVSGEITPDSWTVDKVNLRVINFNLGTKGGNQSDIACLTDDQVRLITETCSKVESYQGEPVDIEWALQAGDLFLLQSRPITTFIPITQEMMTNPGEPRLLYMDESLADGITISGPVSTITNDYLFYATNLLIKQLDKKLDIYQPPKESFAFSTDIRIYANISRFMSVTKNLTSLAETKRIIDTTYADIIDTCDLSPYRNLKSTLVEKLKIIPLFFSLLWNLRGTISSMTRAIFRTEAFQLQYKEKLAAFDQFLAEPSPTQLPLHDFLLHYGIPFMEVTQATTAPALALYMLRGTNSLNKLIDNKSAEQVKLIEAIKSGSEDMVMVMGLCIYELSTLLDPSAFDDLEQLRDKILARTIDPKFLARWDQFIDQFGCRGPLEMDLAQPKYGDDPLVALRQVATVVKSNQTFDPRINHQNLKDNRDKAYLELKSLLPAKKREKLTSAYKYICDFEHSREIPKDHIVSIQKRLREYLIQQAETWVEQGRLDSIEQVFDLKVAEIINAQQHEAADIKKVLANRDPYIERAKRVRHFPHAIDSRGRILHPVTEQIPGQLTGTPVSSGIVSGPVKVMHDPFEKEIEVGDILVAYTTDPGWTPLFINAAAVLLEVGGELQHGALVAREYGKPCVAGIVDVTRTLEDGQMVEVNGNTGQILIL